MADIYEKPTLGARQRLSTRAGARRDLEQACRSSAVGDPDLPGRVHDPLRALTAALGHLGRGGQHRRGHLARHGLVADCAVVGDRDRVALLITPPGRMLVTVLGAWLLLKGIGPGSIRAVVHVRVWAAERLADEMGASKIAGAPWVRLYARALGGKVGRHVDLHAIPPVTGMLTLGDECSIEPEVDLSGTGLTAMSCTWGTWRWMRAPASSAACSALAPRSGPAPSLAPVRPSSGRSRPARRGRRPARRTGRPRSLGRRPAGQPPGMAGGVCRDGTDRHAAGARSPRRPGGGVAVAGRRPVPGGRCAHRAAVDPARGRRRSRLWRCWSGHWSVAAGSRSVHRPPSHPRAAGVAGLVDHPSAGRAAHGSSRCTRATSPRLAARPRRAHRGRGRGLNGAAHPEAHDGE